MRVTAEHVKDAGAGKRQHPGPRGLICEERRRPLKQRPADDEAPESLEEIRDQMSLRMGDQRPKPQHPQAVHRALEPVVKRARGGLEQDPTSRPTEAERRELTLTLNNGAPYLSDVPGQVISRHEHDRQWRLLVRHLDENRLESFRSQLREICWKTGWQ